MIQSITYVFVLDLEEDFIYLFIYFESYFLFDKKISEWSVQLYVLSNILRGY